jgi:nitrite reductase/ring-hydroxylating ferredoxin subunit
MEKIIRISRFLRSGIFSSSLFLVLLIGFSGCSDNQNNFVPYARVDKYISLVNYNNLLIPVNSMTYPADGYAGLIVICIGDQQYRAYDACCPLEGTRTSFVETNPGKPNIFASSTPIAICKTCGSQYNLFSEGYPVKGPSTRNLKQYSVSVLDNRLWIHN